MDYLISLIALDRQDPWQRRLSRTFDAHNRLEDSALSERATGTRWGSRRRVSNGLIHDPCQVEIETVTIDQSEAFLKNVDGNSGDSVTN